MQNWIVHTKRQRLRRAFQDWWRSEKIDAREVWLKKYKTARCWYADPKKCFLPNFAIIDVNPSQLFDGKACNYFPSSKISFWDGAMPHGQCNGRMKPSLDPQRNPKKSEASLQQVVQYNWHPPKSWSVNSIARPRISKQGNVASSSDLQFV